MKTTKKRKRPPQPPQVAIWDCDVLEYGDILDGWRIDAFLSKGGFGAVYYAVACDDTEPPGKPIYVYIIICADKYPTPSPSLLSSPQQ